MKRRRKQSWLHWKESAFVRYYDETREIPLWSLATWKEVQEEYAFKEVDDEDLEFH